MLLADGGWYCQGMPEKLTVPADTSDDGMAQR